MTLESPALQAFSAFVADKAIRLEFGLQASIKLNVPTKDADNNFHLLDNGDSQVYVEVLPKSLQVEGIFLASQ